MTTNYAGRIPPGRTSGRAGGQPPESLAELLADLTVHEKALLLTGADSWRTQGAEALGLRPMIMSDGPAGVRGVVLDQRQPSSSLPCPSALGATWDPELVRELAAALGAEARGKGVDVLLAPTINLMRTPLGGRGFECFAEDPVLTAVLAVAFVRGVQGAGVAATAKHFVGNDSETERWTYDARISESVLRELYLAPFEACVREAGVALVMAAYNKVNGIRMTENARLLRDVLKGEWGFDGVVTSDWHAARSTAGTALAALDLAMPGPDGPWGGQLAAAVADGSGAADVLDDKVIRLLRLAKRVGALTGPTDGAAPVPAPVDPALLRRAAAASFVLLRNENDAATPIDPAPGRGGARGGGGGVRPVAQRERRGTAYRSGPGAAGRRDRAERDPAGHPRRRQRGRDAENRVHSGRRARRGIRRAGRGHRRSRMPDVGSGAGAGRRIAAGPQHRGARAAAGVPRPRRRPAGRRAPHVNGAGLVGPDSPGHRLGPARQHHGDHVVPAGQHWTAPARRGRDRAPHAGR